MKTHYCIILVLLLFSCNKTIDKEKIKDEIQETEKQFQLMTSEKGLAFAFHYFADENAVIKRGNDSLISGKSNIRDFYNNETYQDAKLTWAPDVVEVADCGNLAYSYGKYVFQIQVSDSMKEFSGVFMTIWKRQQDNSWKYVWD